ncbi:ankyrin repeat protein [Bordetella hinzii 5132]|nr:ankyrin repeat protein [Bordetella hinzii 5132]
MFMKELDKKLIEAATIGDLPEIRSLIERGADIHVDDGKPFVVAAEHGRLEVVKYLASQGAHINTRSDLEDRRDRALLTASGNGHLEVVEFLVSAGADIHFHRDCILRWAAGNGQLEVVKFLIDKGADIHASGPRGDTLKEAAENGHLKVVRYLVEKGANIHASENRALKKAAGNGHIDVVELLLEHGAPIESAKKWGTDSVKEFCKVFELKQMLDAKIQQSTPSKPKSARLKI